MHSELTEVTDHDCASLFRSQCVNSISYPNDLMSVRVYFKVIAVVNVAEPNTTWSKRKIEKLIGTFRNDDEWLNR